MRVSVADRLEIADKRTTSAGYLAVRAKIARDGVYEYTRSSIGLDGPPNEIVGVYRSHDWVFNSDNLATFAHKPVCIGHPDEQVNSANWKKLAVGQIGDKVWEAEDRKHVQVDMLIMDQAGIDAANSDHKELSCGYSCEILPQDGVAPDGTPYVAVMAGKLIADHLALVPRGRAGSQARIGDAAWPTENITDSPATAEKWLRKAIALHEKHMNGDAPTTGKAGDASQELMMTQMKNALSELAGEKVKPKMKMDDTTTHTETLVKDAKKMPSLILDGLKVDLSDEEAVSAAFKKLTDAKASAEAATATALSDKATAEAVTATAATAHATAIEAKDAEVATLTATVATLTTELADARDPAKLRDAAAEYAAVVAKATALGATVTDADSAATVKRNAVNAKLGDVAKDWTDAQVDVSFATLTAGVKDAAPIDSFRQARMNMSVGDFGDPAAKAKVARDKMIDGLTAPRSDAK